MVSFFDLNAKCCTAAYNPILTPDVEYVNHEDYSRNLAESERRFGAEHVCRNDLAQLRWPDGFRY